MLILFFFILKDIKFKKLKAVEKWQNEINSSQGKMRLLKYEMMVNSLTVGDIHLNCAEKKSKVHSIV